MVRLAAVEVLLFSTPEEHILKPTFASHRQSHAMTLPNLLSRGYSRRKDFCLKSATCTEVEEGGNTNVYFALSEGPKKQLKQKKGKRFLLVVFFLLVSFLVYEVGFLLLPSYIVRSRVKQAKVELLGGTMRISADQQEVLNPAAHVFVNNRFLQFLGVHYRAHVRPFKASVYIQMPTNFSMNASQTQGTGILNDLRTKASSLGEFIKEVFWMICGLDLRSERREWSKKSLLKVGEIAVAELVIDSTENFNQTIGGQFEFNVPIDNLAFAANEIVSRPSVNATLTATVSVLSMLWGIIPVYFPRISLEYEYVATAFDNFQSKAINVSDLTSCEGYEGYMIGQSMAQFYNPTPFSLQLDTPLRMRMDHALHGHDHTVGYVSFAHLEMNPGWNKIVGNVSLVQTDINIDAIEDLMTQYLADKDYNLQDDVDQRIYVTIRDAGESTASSELLQKACSLISTKIGILPPGRDYIKGVSSDLLFAGSLVAAHPEFYHVTINIKIDSFLPQDVSISYMDVQAYRENISGPLIYSATRKLDPRLYQIPSLTKNHFLHLQLHVDEVKLGTSYNDFLYMANSGITEHTSLGFDARFEVNIGPGGFKQTVRYKRRQIVAMMCYHMVQPPWFCGEHAQIW